MDLIVLIFSRIRKRTYLLSYLIRVIIRQPVNIQTALSVQVREAICNNFFLFPCHKTMKKNSTIYKEEVWAGIRATTPGGLTKKDLMLNSRGVVVYKSRSRNAKKNKTIQNLTRHRSSRRRSSRRTSCHARNGRRTSVKRGHNCPSGYRKSSRRRSSRRVSRRRSSMRRAMYR